MFLETNPVELHYFNLLHFFLFNVLAILIIRSSRRIIYCNTEKFHLFVTTTLVTMTVPLRKLFHYVLNKIQALSVN